MSLRRVLTSLSLVAVTGAVALVPVPASATDATISVTNTTVTFASGGAATLSLTYTCGSAGAPTEDVLGLTIYQPRAEDGYQAAADNPVDGTPVTCDGTSRTLQALPLEVTEGTFHNGAAEASMIIGDDDEQTVYQDVTVVGVPAGLLTLTVNASPEPARKGGTVKVKGTATRDGKSAGKLKVDLLFVKDGGDEYTKIKTVKSDKKGKLSTKVKATRSGTYAFAYGDVLSAGDDLEVIPAIKRYKNCAALNKVYPNGVGKKGAVDKGGSVDDFTVDNAVYAKNKKSDRDKDGIACER